MATPHKCPVCEGTGMDVHQVTSCDACSGTGIVWEPAYSVPVYDDSTQWPRFTDGIHGTFGCLDGRPGEPYQSRENPLKWVFPD